MQQCKNRQEIETEKCNKCTIKLYNIPKKSNEKKYKMARNDQYSFLLILTNLMPRKGKTITYD